MTLINIQVGHRGVERITAVGETASDRREALQILTRIEPELERIDQECAASVQKADSRV